MLAATPIGDVADAPPSLGRALGAAELIAAEDTRRLRDLARRLEVTIGARVISFHEHNEADRIPLLLEAARAGQLVVVVSDAGMPAISDPGFRLVQAAIDAEVELSVLPGPSAVLTALALSGLPTDRFCFEGFLPRRAGERHRMLEQLRAEPRTMVFFESPHRVAATLADMAAVFGAERRAAVCRELSKTYEEVRRGGLAELAQWAQDGVRGEITVVVAGAVPRAARVDDHLVEVLERASRGERLKDVASEVAHRTGLRSRDLYQAAVEFNREQSPPGV